MFDDAEAKAILQRAIELDATRGVRVTGDELVQIAAELGVSEAAIRDAIAERSAVHPPVVVEPASVSRQISPLRLLNLGTGAGVGSGLLLSQMLTPQIFTTPLPMGAILFVLGGMAMASGGLALSDRTRSAVNFLQRNASLWLGFGAGWVLSGLLFAKYGSVALRPTVAFELSLLFTFVGGAVTTVVGSLFMAVRSVGAGAGATHDGAKPTSGDGPSRIPELKLRVLRTLRRWFSATHGFLMRETLQHIPHLNRR